MRFRGLEMRGALAVLVLTIAHSAVTTNAQCSAPDKTLSFKCSGACDEYSPCWRIPTNDSTECVYECYNMYSDASKSAFTFLVPFKTADATTADMSRSIFKDNERLTAIDTLVLPSTTTKVSIIGGSYIKTNYVRGRAVTVTLAPDLVAQYPQVTDVNLANIDLAAAVNGMTAMLPATTKTLTLNNDLLKDFPAGFAKLTALQELTLTNNYIMSVDASMAIDSVSTLAVDTNSLTSFSAVFKNAALVTLASNKLSEYPSVFAEYPRLATLYLDNNLIPKVERAHATKSLKALYLGMNKITKFDAIFPSLTYLDLRGNSLTEIPNVLFNYTSLATLNLAGNPMKNVSLTSQQASLFAKISNLTLDESSLNKDCSTDQQREIRGINFCIVEANELAKSGTNSGSTASDSSGNTNGATNGSTSSSTPTIVGVAGGVVVVVALIGFFVFRNKSRAKSTESTTGGRAPTASTHGTWSASTSIPLWNDAALLAIKVDTSDIQDLRRLGKGAYGEVWLVRYRSSQLLASKRLLKPTTDETQAGSRVQDFVAEIKLVAKLEHPKIVQFVAVAWTLEADLQALFEYMDGGDLREYLASEYTPRTWSSAKVRIAIDIAEALVYVHSFNPPLVHRDLKSRNVLLNASVEAKLTDFGVSRYQSENKTMTSGVGTARWLAPEVIAGATDYGPPADIFSFGAVLSELDTHQLPYDGVVGPNGNKLADVALLQLISTGQLRPTFHSACPRRIVDLAYRCFELNPMRRPTATEIAFELRNIARELKRRSK